MAMNQTKSLHESGGVIRTGSENSGTRDSIPHIPVSYPFAIIEGRSMKVPHHDTGVKGSVI